MTHGTFALAPCLLDDILEALETQGKVYEVCGSSLREINDSIINSDAYPLPEWGSDKGYALREEFVRRLHAPVAADALQEALHSGRGAFRAFKDAIKMYPQVQRLWHRYKRQRMKDYVYAWYDGLCDEWGLERMERIADDDSGMASDLLKEDFEFVQFSAEDGDEAANAISAALAEADEAMQDDVSLMDNGAEDNLLALRCHAARAVAARWQRSVDASGGNAFGAVCRTVDGAFAGFITWEEDSAHQAVFLTGLAVVKEWRGLGIASALLEECLTRIKGNHCATKARWCVIWALPIASVALEALMQKAGFESPRRILALDL